MAGGEPDGPGFPTSGLIAALVLVASAIAVQQVPYIASRPALTETARRQFVATQDVEARLWQDPFTAITQHIEQAPARAPDGTDVEPIFEAYRHSAGLMQSLLTTRPSDTIVMPVMVQGGPYGEEVEGRRRTRHALVTALNKLGFAPEDSEHVGYVRPWPATDGVELPRIVPWERFAGSSLSSKASVVLVLWVDSNAFRQSRLGGPLVKLGRLLEALALCPGEGDLPEGPHIAIIGPADSDGLQAMMRRLRGPTMGRGWRTPAWPARRSTPRGPRPMSARTGRLQVTYKLAPLDRCPARGSSSSR